MSQGSGNLLRDPKQLNGSIVPKHALIESLADWLQANEGNPLLLLDVESQTVQRTAIAGTFESYDSTARTIKLKGLPSIPDDYTWNYRIPWDVPVKYPNDYSVTSKTTSFNRYLWNLSDTNPDLEETAGWINPSHVWPRAFLLAQQNHSSPVYLNQQHFKCISIEFKNPQEKIRAPKDVYQDGEVPIGDINCCGGGNG